VDCYPPILPEPNILAILKNVVPLQMLKKFLWKAFKYNANKNVHPLHDQIIMEPKSFDA
jgi:hypothetical protein